MWWNYIMRFCEHGKEPRLKAERSSGLEVQALYSEGIATQRGTDVLNKVMSLQTLNFDHLLLN